MPGAAEATEAVAPGLLDLIEYVPPALPGARTEAVGTVGFVASGARAEAAPPVAITYDTNRRTWLVVSDYSYAYEGNTITAKAGFAYDLSSIPRPLWWLIAPNELSILAPLFHDLMYRYQGELPDDQVSPYRTYTRREADDLFYHLMQVEGVAGWRRRAAYAAVRAAGGFSW
jgi:hypothetical protein